MKYSIFLFAISATFLPGCGRHNDDKSGTVTNAVTASQPEAVAIFSHTENFSEPEILAAAAMLSHAKQAIGSQSAEHCWDTEAKRPAVREACILTWSMGTQDSVYLEGIFHALARDPELQTRAFAIACIRKASLLSGLAFNDLLAILRVLSKDPPWIRSLGAYQWLSANPVADAVQAGLIWNAINMDEKSAKSAGPLSLGGAYRVAAKLGLSQAEGMLAAYCNPGVSGHALLRCWRFFSTVVNPATGQGLDQRSISLLPTRRDSGWTLFERSFPERALLLQRYLH